MAYIYKIINPKGKVYIGSTKSIKTRERYYRGSRCKGQVRLYNSIQKYGWDTHSFSLIESCDESNQFTRERYWQDYYNVLGDGGLNCVLVGTDQTPHMLSQQTRDKMSASRKGTIKSQEWQENINIAIKGLNKSEEHKSKISMAKLGTKEPEEIRLKKSKARIGKKHSAETIEKIRKGQENKKIYSKKVIQYNLDGEVLKEWVNCKEASQSLQISIAYIRDAARGVYQHKAHGFMWKYQ